MKKSVFFVSLLFFLISIFSVSFATYRPKATLTKIKSGSYDPKILTTGGNMRSLPIPHSNENYAFYQSIGEVTNIVLGKFQVAEQEIVLITDRNSDGKVDKVYVYDVLKRKKKNINRTYTKKQFKEMKDGIFSGKARYLGVNEEGVDFIKTLIKSNSDLVKMARSELGYRVQIFDPDNSKSFRAKFFFSKGIYGADMAFEINYYNVGETHVKPIIPMCVFAQDSKDAYAQEKVKELKTYIEKNVIFE